MIRNRSVAEAQTYGNSGGLSKTTGDEDLVGMSEKTSGCNILFEMPGRSQFELGSAVINGAVMMAVSIVIVFL